MQRDRSVPLAQRVYDKLLADIAAQQRRAGERLVEADIARDANVSRTPVREALGRLASNGLIEPQHPNGYVICAPSMQDIREIFEIRRALEPGAFAGVVQRALREDDRKFNSLCDAVWDADSPATSASSNKALRGFWVERISNSRVRELLLRYHLQVQIVRAATLDTAEGRAAARAGTEKLRAAYMARDSDAALLAMTDFVDAALSLFERAELDGNRSRAGYGPWGNLENPQKVD